MRTLKCPICGQEVAFDDPYMPVCSKRCQLIDLGNWASEKYVISTPEGSSLEELDIPVEKPDEE